MNTSTRAAADFAARRRRNVSGKFNPYAICGGVTAAGAVLTCGLMVYANVFGASVYPTAAADNVEVAVVKRTSAPAVRSAQPAFDEVFASLSQPTPLIS